MTGIVSTSGLSVLFVVLWSSGWIGSKFGLDYTGIYTLLALRYLLLTLLLVVLAKLFVKWQTMSRNELLKHSVIGVLCHAVFLVASLSPMGMGVSAGIIAFMAALQPIFTAVASTHLTGEKISASQWCGLVLGLASVIIVIGDRVSMGGSPLAYGLLVLSVIAICCGTLLDKRMGLKNKDQGRTATPLLQVLLIHALSSTLVLVPLAALTEGFEARWSGELVFAIGWLAVVVSLLAYGLMFVLLRRLPTFKVSCLIYLTPPTTMLVGFFAFNELLTITDLAGLALAAIAVWTINQPGRDELKIRQPITPDIDLGKQVL